MCDGSWLINEDNALGTELHVLVIAVWANVEIALCGGGRDLEILPGPWRWLRAGGMGKSTRLHSRLCCSAYHGLQWKVPQVILLSQQCAKCFRFSLPCI